MLLMWYQKILINVINTIKKLIGLHP